MSVMGASGPGPRAPSGGTVFSTVTRRGRAALAAVLAFPLLSLLLPAFPLLHPDLAGHGAKLIFPLLPLVFLLYHLLLGRLLIRLELPVERLLHPQLQPLLWCQLGFGSSCLFTSGRFGLFQLLAHSRGRCRPGQLLPWGRRRLAAAGAAAVTVAGTGAAAGAATAAPAGAGAAAMGEAAAAGRAEGPAAAAGTAAVVPGAPAAPPIAVPRAGAAPASAAGPITSTPGRRA